MLIFAELYAGLIIFMFILVVDSMDNFGWCREIWGGFKNIYDSIKKWCESWVSGKFYV
jgi:hypothetical protein